jgi:flagella basal body P-ring formation protein FlgA
MMRTIQNLNLAIAFLTACGFAQPTLAVDVKLRERVVISTSVVRLRDVAEITAADRAQGRELAAVPLMPLPAPGTQRFLRKREVADLLAAHGVDLRQIDFVGADQIEVVAASVVASVRPSEDLSDEKSNIVNQHAAILAGGKVEPALLPFDEERAEKLRDELRALIASYINSKAGNQEPRRVEFDVADRYLAMLDAATSQPMCRGGNEPWTGSQRFVISFTTPQGQAQVPLYAEVAGPAVSLVVALRPIARGQMISAADIELRKVENNSRSADRRSTFDAVEQLVGMEARQSIAAGDVVLANQVQLPVLVKRGELIAITSQSGRIRVRTTARARQDGSRGDCIEVESPGSKERYDVCVVGTREASLVVESQTASAKSTRGEAARR